ncbi:MAG: hypothetical protein IPP64_03280 [Bacteroidetes bacterium]|nr:hypothetical protein [Bacteroidota bacterium]
MIRTTKYIAIFIASLSLISCGGSEKPTETPVDSTEVKTNIDTSKTVVFYNIPSPLETFTILKMSGSAFDKAVLNPTDKMSKYVTSFSKAVNLGAYSSDLSFCYLYKQNQDFNNYLKNINELTTALSIDGSYGQEVNKRLQANSSNLDSLMAIVTEAGINADQYLKDNQRNTAVALIAAGGWVEAMYILTNIADKTQKEDVIGLVGDQKIVLKNLTNMLEQFEGDEEINSLLTDMKGIASIYESVQATPDKPITSDKDIISVGNNSSYKLSKEQLKAVLEKVTVLRNKITL